VVEGGAIPYKPDALAKKKENFANRWKLDPEVKCYMNMEKPIGFTPLDAAHLTYDATIEDPQVFMRPWKISMPLYRRIEKGAQLPEFKCVEYAEEMLYGDLRKK
jgi:hypothetical protein